MCLTVDDVLQLCLAAFSLMAHKILSLIMDGLLDLKNVVLHLLILVYMISEKNVNRLPNVILEVLKGKSDLKFC